MDEPTCHVIPPNFRIEQKRERSLDEHPCRDCKFQRSFFLHPTCIKYLSYVRLNNTCDDWESGRSEVLHVINKYVEPTDEEEAFLKSSKIRELRNFFSVEEIKNMQKAQS